MYVMNILMPFVALAAWRNLSKKISIKLIGEIATKDFFVLRGVKNQLLEVAIMILKSISELGYIAITLNTAYTSFVVLFRWMTNSDPFPITSWVIGFSIVGGIIIADMVKTWLCRLYQKRKVQPEELVSPQKTSCGREYFEGIPGCEIISYTEKTEPIRNPVKEAIGHYFAIAPFCGLGAFITEGGALLETFGPTTLMLIGIAIIILPWAGLFICAPKGGTPETYILQFSNELSAKHLLQIQEKYQLKQEPNDIWIATPKGGDRK